MAIVNAPALSLQASGDLGGINYSRHRGVAVAREKYSPVQPNTGIQATVQGYWTSLVTRWTTILTTDQIELWRISARKQVFKNKLGDPYIPSGFSYYMRINQVLLCAGMDKKDTPPVNQPDVRVMYMTSIITPSGPFIRILPYDSDGAVLDVETIQLQKAGPWSSSSRVAQENDYRNLFYRDASAGWITDFSVVVGNFYYYKCRWIDTTGQTGPWMYLVAEI